MIRLLPFALVLALAACGGSPRDTAAPATGDTVTVTTSNFTDADPTDWPGRSPDRYPVHGIETSRAWTA